MHNRLLAVAAILAAITVAMGALGAHALKNLLSETQLHSYDTAVKYQLFHALALFLRGVVARTNACAQDTIGCKWNAAGYPAFWWVNLYYPCHGIPQYGNSDFFYG